MHVVKLGVDRILKIPADDIVTPIRQVDPEQEFDYAPTPCRQRVQRAPATAQKDHEPDVDLGYLAQRVDTLSGEQQYLQRDQQELQRDHQWMMGSLSGLLAKQGLDYPPYLRSDDRAGTSGI